MLQPFRSATIGAIRRHAAQAVPLALLFGGTLGAALSAMGTQVILARSLTLSDYGQLAAVLAAANLLSPVAGFGLNWFWVQVFGREGWNAFRWIVPSLKVLGIASLLSLAALSTYLLTASTLAPDVRVAVTVLACCLLLGQVAVDIASSKYQLEERFGLLAVWQTLPQIGRLAIALFVFAAPAYPFMTVLGGYAGISVAQILIGLVVLRQFLMRGIRLVGHTATTSDIVPDVPGVVRTATLALPFAFITVFYLVYFQSSVLLLHAFIGARETAIFSAALLIMAAIYLIPNIVFSKFLAARICRWADHDPDRYAAALHVSVAAMAASGLLLMIALIGLAPITITMLFGIKYAPTIIILTWLAPTVPLRFVQSAYSAVLVSEVDVRRRVSYAGISAGVSLSANLILLPIIGLPGAVIASIASEGSLMILNMWGVHRHVSVIDIRHSFRPTHLRAAALHLMRGGA
jgi:O-antigen/teichoic acid export membrane protein